MDSFKPIDIDEFDLKFKQDFAPVAAVPPVEPLVHSQEADYLGSGRDSIIPEVLIEEKPRPVRTAVVAAVAPVQPLQQQAEDAAGSVQSAKAADNIITPDFSVNRESEPADFEQAAADDYQPVQQKGKSGSIGRAVAKGGVIFLLAVTIVTFVLGCFVSMFLDNDSVGLKGRYMCTVRQDVEGVKWLREGSLVVYQKVAPGDIKAKQIAVIYTNGVPGFFAVNSVEKAVTGEYMVVASPAGNSGTTNLGFNTADVAGIAVRYVPAVAGVVSFAMNNAILVCALFILLVVFLGLIIVLIERTKIQ